MAPRLKILMSSGSKKESRYIFYFLSKIPANKPPPGSLTGPLWRETAVHRAFCVPLENLIKNSSNKKALGKKRSSMFPKSGAPMEADAHFRALLNVPFGVPSKGTLPQGPLHRLHGYYNIVGCKI